jgi:hypothetical protein
MKPSRNAAVLAASLSSAAAMPLQTAITSSIRAVPAAAAELLPEPEVPVERRQVARPLKREKKVKELADTMQMTLRPSRELVESYVNEAADRSKREGRMVSAQQVMLEVLATGPKVKS